MSGKVELSVEVTPDHEDGGFIATVVGHPGIISDGDTEEEAVRNVLDAYLCVVQALVDIPPTEDPQATRTHHVLLSA